MQVPMFHLRAVRRLQPLHQFTIPLFSLDKYPDIPTMPII